MPKFKSVAAVWVKVTELSMQRTKPLTLRTLCFVEIKTVCLVIFKCEQGHGAGGEARISERVKQKVLQLESLRRARKW